DARRVRFVSEKKKVLLNDKKLKSDERQSLNDTITAYRRIYRELLQTAEHLRRRGEQYREA
ncbi:MAG: hypothetical protein IJG87_10065, partial [Ruminococcus sp.]|nr:hypothetical protein [Ruminococcus sp.]